MKTFGTFRDGSQTPKPALPEGGGLTGSGSVMADPAPPHEYGGLRVGAEISLEMEAAQALPVDGSAKYPRSVSPFMIRMEPPLVYGSSEFNNRKSDYIGLLDNGHTNAPTAYNTARKNLTEMYGGQWRERATAEGSYVVNGTIVRSKGGRDEAVSSDPRAKRLGTPALADVYSALDQVTQLKNILNMPPLILLINPQTLSLQRTKIQTMSDRSRSGLIFAAFGEEQPRLEVTAKCGAFIAGGKGVQFASRRDSAAWQNLQTAFLFYKNNGYLYDTVNGTYANHMVGSLSIHFDGWVYYGHLEGFELNQDEDNQLGGVEFNLNMVVSSMVDTGSDQEVVLPLMDGVRGGAQPNSGSESHGGGAPGYEYNQEMPSQIIIDTGEVRGARKRLEMMEQGPSNQGFELA